MSTSIQSNKPGLVSGEALKIWRGVQVLVWLIGFGIFVLLLVAPTLGLHAFWNILIPVAPALLVVAVGLWRNICPLGSTALLPQYLGFGLRKKLSRQGQTRLCLTSVALLLLIIPLRHVIWDMNGLATAILLASLATTAIILSAIYDRKSAWCAGVCPIHPVEKLYGGKPLVQVPNLHCQPGCQSCVAVCPDSIKDMHPLLKHNDRSRYLIGLFMVGAFPGYIWGWFHVPNYIPAVGWAQLHIVYGLPFAAAACTLALFVTLRKLFSADWQSALISAFATAAVACYYWYRLPALVGYGLFPGDGMLIDLTAKLSPETVALSRIVTTSFFIYFVLLRNKATRAWSIRPPVIKPAPMKLSA